MRWKMFKCLVLFSCYGGHSQIGINTNSPKAVLDVEAINKTAPTQKDGILFPRVNQFSVTNPGSNQNGMLVYLTANSGSSTPGFYY